MILWRQAPLCYCLLNQRLDDWAVLGVDADHSAVPPGESHGLEQRAVIEHENAGISHEQFETGYPLMGNQRLHVGQGLRVDLEHDHMGANVDASAGGAAVPILQTDEGTLPTGLVAEIDHRRRTAKGGGHGSGGESVDSASNAEVPIKVGMHIDAAWQHQQTAGVVYFDVSADRNLPADGANATVLDQDIGLVIVDRGHNPPMLDQHCCHLPLSPCCLRSVLCPLYTSCGRQRKGGFINKSCQPFNVCGALV